MSEGALPVDLVDHLCRHSHLSETQARHLIEEVLAFYRESEEHFICRRHRELQAAGLANATIFRAIQAELPARRFPGGRLSERQIRRAIYG